jgi:hypothetical protein
MSAIAITPVEIWAEIIHQALFNPAIFQSDPFYPGCNLHTALREWYDYAPFIEARRCHATLRLVSKSWKVLVDAYQNWFLESKHLDEGSLVQSRWRSARRIHLDVFPRKCRCRKECFCISNDYYAGQSRAGKASLYFIPALHTIQELASIPVRTMVVSIKVWNLINNHLPQKTVATIFSQLRTLEVVGEFERSLANIPSFLESLTYLNVGLDTDGQGNPLTFPNLTTLRVRIANRRAFTSFKWWVIPKLLNLEIRDVCSWESPLEIDEYLKRGWPLLESFRFIVDDRDTFIPNDIWDSLPKLTYAGFTRLARSGQALSPTNHPLHTLALLTLHENGESRCTIANIMLNFLNLRVVADSHRWEDIPAEILGTHINSSFAHKHYWPLCFLCLMDLTSACRQAGLRYEDRWGRSLGEFLRGLVKA